MVNVQRYGGWLGCKRAHCRNPSDVLTEPEESQAGALEALALRHNTPVISLHRATAHMLDTPLYMLADFMTDCR